MRDANLLKSSCISLDNFVIAFISMLALKTSDELGTVLPSPLLFSQEHEDAQHFYLFTLLVVTNVSTFIKLCFPVITI